MANLELLVTLLRAVGGATHVVLVGDADQLAPVGAGKPFAELVHQPGAGGPADPHLPPGGRRIIVQGAHAIRRGLHAAIRARHGMRRDLFLIERN